MLSSTFPFPASPVLLSCWSSHVDSWECGSGNIFFHWQNLFKRFNSFIFLLTFLLLFIASVLYSGGCIVVTETIPVIWFTARPYEQLLRQHDREDSKWRWEFSKPVVVKVRRVTPELFQIILMFKREKVGGKKSPFIRRADIAGRKRWTVRQKVSVHSLVRFHHGSYEQMSVNSFWVLIFGSCSKRKFSCLAAVAILIHVDVLC